MCLNMKVIVKFVKFNFFGDGGARLQGKLGWGIFIFRCSLLLLPSVIAKIVILKEKYIVHMNLLTTIHQPCE